MRADQVERQQWVAQMVQHAHEQHEIEPALQHEDLARDKLFVLALRAA
jgi:hypothetical protein